MVNKNQFSIKNTKKVLHKVGKHWVVVSALLLGLAAGGTAVTTQANAAETNAAQPRTEVNMSANHSLGAENPAATNAIDGAKAKVSSVKTYIQQDSSYANVTNLTKLAKTVYGSSAASNAYQNLGSLAASASDYKSLSVGNTSKPASNTVFSMFSQASNDFNTISNAQSTSNGKHYLGKITSLFSEADSFANDTSLGEKSGQSSNVSFSSQITLPLSSQISVNGNKLNLTGSVTPTLSFNSEVGINVPKIINKGINISSIVSDFAKTFADENTGAISGIIYQAEAANDEPLYSQVKSILSNQNNVSTMATTYGTDYYDLKSISVPLKGNIGSELASEILNDNPKTLDKMLHSYLTKYSNVLGILGYNGNDISQKANMLNTEAQSDPAVKNALQNASNTKDAIDAVKTALNDITANSNIADNDINDAISDSASTMYSKAISSVASNVANFAGSLFATSGNSLSNYQVGPFAGYNLSSVTSYINKVNGNLSSANSEFASASSANSASKSSYMNSLGLPEALESTISGFISTASNYANKASHYVSDVTEGLNGFFGSKSTTKPAYNNLINAVAALPNDLQPTSNASSGSTEEAKLYNDYSNIASNTSDIDNAAMSHTAAYSNGSRIKRYVSDANRDATNSIVNEANSSANSMSTVSASISSAIFDINSKINNYIKNSTKASGYIDAFNRAQADLANAELASSAYNNSLDDTASASASAASNDANAISLSSSTQSGKSGSQPASGKSGSQPASGKSGSQPASGKSGSQPASGKSGSQPASGKSGSQPASGKSGSQPASGKSGSQPASGKSGSQPASGKSGSQPASGKSGSQPASGKSGSQPASGKSSSQPASDNSSASAKASASASASTSIKNSSIASYNSSVSASNSTKNSIASSEAASTASSEASSVASSKSAASSKAASEAAASASANNMPFVPSFNGNSSVASSNASVPASAVANSVSANSNSSKAASKSKVANYVTVQKELQLHTSPNFTKKNRVMTVEPGTRLDLEKTVRARHGLVRYEVNYKGKNYFITANKKYTTHMSYALAKPSHYRYFKVGKTLQLHTSPYFTKKNGVITVKPNSEFRINKVVKAGKFVRYEVSYKGSVYFVTANKAFSANAYLQKSNFGKHGHKAVRVIKKLSEYKKVNFKKHSLIRNFRKGSVLPVKRVITIANGEMTRLQLTNGRYVTANKDFVKAIK